MLIKAHWKEICRVVARGQRSTLYCSMGSVNPDGSPHVTPIGTVFLRGDGTGFYFDAHTEALARNLDADPRVCLMAIDTGRWFWSFLLGRFTTPPGVRLNGTVSALRLATPDELQEIARRIGPVRWLKGSRLLWSNFTHVRDITFTSFRPVTYPRMMDGLWRSND
ncbi:pyridoxamine 5'-phosphate oxidase family protein [Polaromonas sp. JS666]|uniref:pyridoxamine 5'-phosphate oxidase family protein n=1 Tax=Polaromonas sp. (strain JS666 / ATCC BAA-500) TaxID=296591 RepID=UPI0000536E41|nr:pyridoxamine 5'-phosphate oxidase family protein [Polaromonas sp. JS666]ABE47188.1 pyridoxamine 5'-phosphate oxidase-related, FMN-binding [Polaromonas sp. JS666]